MPPPEPSPSSRDAGPGDTGTSLGLSRRKAAVLAYSAGWLSGVLVLWLEGRDHETRWHAAQSVLGFGLLSLVGAVLLAVAAFGVLSSLTVFRVGLWAAQGLLLVGVGLWVWSVASVALGGTPRWPLLGSIVDRLAGNR